MAGYRITIPRGWRWRDGKLQRSNAHLDVSTRLKRQASKRVRVVPRRPASSDRSRRNP